MALIYSAEVAVGRKLEHFVLEDASGNSYDSHALCGKGGFIIAVMCNHCPYSNAIWSRLLAVAEFAKKLDITTIAINPNIHPNYPEDSPSHMIDKIEEMHINFPYLIDEQQNVSKSLGAVCTPDIFLFDANTNLYYHGRLDDNWRDERSVKEEDLREAIMLLFGKQEPPIIQRPSQGCSIKWKDTVTG
ncbi:MAG: thioredoxin family protein [Sulfurospirillaceae bacterium]|nr:thioredoxin family protein [Sulfurospirillaceae bacterium]